MIKKNTNLLCPTSRSPASPDELSTKEKREKEKRCNRSIRTNHVHRWRVMTDGEIPRPAGILGEKKKKKKKLPLLSR